METGKRKFARFGKRPDSFRLPSPRRKPEGSSPDRGKAGQSEAPLRNGNRKTEVERRKTGRALGFLCCGFPLFLRLPSVLRQTARQNAPEKPPAASPFPAPGQRGKGRKGGRLRPAGGRLRKNRKISGRKSEKRVSFCLTNPGKSFKIEKLCRSIPCQIPGRRSDLSV